MILQDILFFWNDGIFLIVWTRSNVKSVFDEFD
jgi:hypothetical protein